MSIGRLLIAIDPGKSGGIAVGASWTEKIDAYAMPAELVDVRDLLLGLLDQAMNRSASARVIMEKINPFMGRKIPGSRGFAFGESYGYILGLIDARSVPMHLVAPKTWQKALGVGSKTGRSDGDWKRHLRASASRMLGNRLGQTKTTLKTADSLLILRYAELELEHRGPSAQPVLA